MPTNAPEVSLSTDFQTCSIARSVLRQIASLHHRPPCFFALIGDTHGFPGDALRMANVFCGPLPSKYRALKFGFLPVPNSKRSVSVVYESRGQNRGPNALDGGGFRGLRLSSAAGAIIL